MKELRMRNGDVVDADEIDAIKTDSGEWVSVENHRLANADPATQPAPAPWDDDEVDDA